MKNPAIPQTAKAIVASTATSPIAKQLLNAIPSGKGLSLSPREMRISLHLLLGINLKMKEECCRCEPVQGSVPLTMYHALSCKKHGGLILRHDLVKDVLADLCHSARQAVEVEPNHVLHAEKLRPDLLVRFACKGHDAAYDLTIHNPVRNDQAISMTVQNEQKFLEKADREKRNKYQEVCAANGMLFIPIVMSAFGGILEESYREGIEALVSKIKNDHFVPPNWAAPNKEAYWLQRIAIALWAGNVRKVSSFLKSEPLQRN